MLHCYKYVCFLSYFDHWLTDHEADNCKVLSFDIAKNNRLLNTYIQGEKCFLCFYTRISDFAIDLKNNHKFQTNSEKFENIVRNSLREKSLLKISYPKLGVLAEGGYDRTDMLFIPDDKTLNQIQDLAKTTGLFVIEIMSYDYYQHCIDNGDVIIQS